MVITPHRLAITLSACVALGPAGTALGDAPPHALLPPEARRPLPAFAPLTGPTEGDRLSPEDLPGRITLINLWYEW